MKPPLSSVQFQSKIPSEHRYGNSADLPVRLAFLDFSSVDVIERAVLRRLIFALWFARHYPYRRSVLHSIYEWIISIDVRFLRSGRRHFSRHGEASLVFVHASITASESRSDANSEFSSCSVERDDSIRDKPRGTASKFGWTMDIVIPWTLEGSRIQ
jgi:hypothetical protein